MLRLATALLVLAPLCLAAQEPRGSGITTFNGERTSLSFVRARYASPNAQQLKAVVVFRGRVGWTGSALASARMRQAREDSVKVAMRRRGVEQSGGLITEHAIAWIGYDRHKATLDVHGIIYQLPQGDSTLVLLVDAVDTGAPRVQRLVAPLPLEYLTGNPSSMTSDIPAPWWEFVQASPRLRAFVEPALLP